MLNELLALYKSLEHYGIAVDSWHPWVKPLKKGEAILARLDQKAIIKELTSLSPKETTRLRNIAPDNQKSFPGFNLKCPIMAFQETSLSSQSLASLTRSLGENIELAYKDKDLRRLKRLLTAFPVHELLPAFSAEGGERLNAALELLNRLRVNEPIAEDFLRQFANAISVACEKGKITEELAASILFGKFNNKSKRYDSWNLTLLLDVYDLDSFLYSVNDPAVAQDWNRVLFRAAKQRKRSVEKGFYCSLTGNQDTEFRDKFPEPTLPYLGKTYLLSMNSDIPCQTRYARTGSAIFPVGATSVQHLQDTIQSVTKEEQRGQCWTGVPNESRDQNDLLITYLEEEPFFDAPLISYFSEDSNEGEISTYASRTAELHKTLALHLKSREDAYIRVFVLSQIDKGRKQVLFSNRYSVQAVYSGRNRWIAGADNIPAVRISYPQGKGKPLLSVEKTVPGPVQAMLSFKRHWIRNGEGSSPIPGVGLGRIYDLLLDSHPEMQAQWLTQLYIPRTEALLLGVGQSLHGDMFDKKVLTNSSCREAHTIIAVYGILLHCQERDSEVYMQGREYLLGQFLQFADRLHKLYCQFERNNQIPPQLIGNAAFAMTVQRPSRAFEMLGQRMMVYLAWAERYNGKQDADLVKRTRDELGSISGRLKDMDLDSAISPRGKAELLLGYLATSNDENEERK